MTISTSKILIIVNSNSALSTQVADYYISARGLVSNKLSFSFSSTLSIGHSEAIAIHNSVGSYIINNSIEAVICSADVPHSYTGYDGVSRCFSNALGISRLNYAATSLPPTMYGDLDSLLVTNGIKSSGYYEVKQDLSLTTSITSGNTLTVLKVISTDYKKPTLPIPWGRLGIPKYHSYYPDESFTTTKRIIDDAIFCEKADNFINAPIHVQYNDINYGSYNAVWRDNFPFTEWGRRELTSIGAHNFKVCTTGFSVPIYRINGAVLDAYSGLVDNSNYYFISDYDQNIIAGNKRQLWGYLGGARNLYGATSSDGSNFNSHANCYEFIKGSWTCGGMSYGCSEFGARALLDGACSVVGTINEPYGDALPDIYNFCSGLKAGLSMCEAMLLSTKHFYWQMDCWGDPLYRPIIMSNTGTVLASISPLGNKQLSIFKL